MSMFPFYGENFPYTNFHDMNLDWILRTIREMDSKLDKAIASKITVADPMQWSIASQYPQFTIVMDNGNAYLSMKAVPYGIDIENTEYWQKVFDLSEIFNSLKDAISFSDDGNSTTSSIDREVNSLVWLHDTLYVVTNNISTGDAYTANNCQPVSVEDWVTQIVNAMNTALNNKIDTAETKILNTYKRNRKSVILIGDSYGITTEMWDGWLDQFDDMYGDVYTVHGQAVGGSGFKYGNDNIPNFNMILQDVLASMTQADKEAVTDVIVIGGYNDVSRSTSDEQLVTLMKEFKNTALTGCPYAKVSVGFCGVHYGNETVMTYCRSYNAKYHASAEKAGIAFIENLILVLLNKAMLYTESGSPSANFHPNTQGNNELARKLNNYIMTGKIGRITYAGLSFEDKWNVYVEDGTVSIFSGSTAPFLPHDTLTLPPSTWVDLYGLSSDNLLWFFNNLSVVSPCYPVFDQLSSTERRMFFLRFNSNKIQIANLLYGSSQTLNNNTPLASPSAITLPWETVY